MKAMTEEEWLTCDAQQLTAMINTVGGSFYDPAKPPVRLATRRQLLLLAVRCLERVAHLVLDQRTAHAIEAAERFAEGDLSEAELRVAMHHAEHAARDLWQSQRHEPEFEIRRQFIGKVDIAECAMRLSAPPRAAASVVLPSIARGLKYWARANGRGGGPVADRERRAQLGVLRDIFGNPFRPVAFNPAWRTSTAVGLAEGIYAERAFDRLPILADALQDAGCEDADIRAHCRGDGPHVRGCWVVDLVLGKE